MRKWLALLCLSLALLLTGCKEKVTIGETQYPIDTAELNLSGAPPEKVEVLKQFSQLTYLDVCNTGITGETYDRLTAMLPGCRISWTPMFQGKAYPADTTTLTAAELTGAEGAELAYFPKLTSLDATACRNYDALLTLMSQYPNLQVDYVAEAQRELTNKLGRTCRIAHGKRKGRVEIEYYGVDDLNELLDALAKIGK